VPREVVSKLADELPKLSGNFLKMFQGATCLAVNGGSVKSQLGERMKPCRSMEQLEHLPIIAVLVVEEAIEDSNTALEPAVLPLAIITPYS
jgi:hypothetical protein